MLDAFAQLYANVSVLSTSKLGYDVWLFKCIFNLRYFPLKPIEEHL